MLVDIFIFFIKGLPQPALKFKLLFSNTSWPFNSIILATCKFASGNSNFIKLAEFYLKFSNIFRTATFRKKSGKQIMHTIFA